MLNFLRHLKRFCREYGRQQKRFELHRKYRDVTMVPAELYAANLELAERVKAVPGVIVECGVWRGGMIAGLAEILGPDRDYYLFDSFEGLPPAQEIDGPAAAAWQQSKSDPFYFDNCVSSQALAEATLARSPARRIHIQKGWFNQSVPLFPAQETIALLRLDGDWYESTMVCLENLYPRLVKGGLLILDDYYTWEGCCRAVQDYFCRNQIVAPIQQHPSGVAYTIKK